MMDLTVLKKKISSYKTTSGKVTKVPDDLVMEILHAWEQWSGPTSGFYPEIGVSSKKMAAIIGRGKTKKVRGTPFLLSAIHLLPLLSVGL